MNIIKPEDRQLHDRFGRPRVGNYMHTAGGEKYWPFDPRADEVKIATIAHQLAGQNRWQGAVRHRRFKMRIFYSVAEHSHYCARYMIEVLKRPDLALEALLHDASEAYIGDLIRPLKYDPQFREPFRVVEDLNEKVIAERFNLVYPFPAEVKIADEAICEAESQQIVPRDPDEEWDTGAMHDRTNAAPYEITMHLPSEAKAIFMLTYRRLMADRAKYRPLPELDLL